MRRRKINLGRWQTERERCCISADLPPAAPIEAVPLAEVLPGLLKRTVAAEPRWMKILSAEWPGIAGSRLAGHVRPGIWRKGTLYLLVDNAMWLNETRRYFAETILSGLQKRFGSKRIREIELRLDSGPPASPPRR